MSKEGQAEVTFNRKSLGAVTVQQGCSGGPDVPRLEELAMVRLAWASGRTEASQQENYSVYATKS